MYRVLYILILFIVFPVSAQDRFITLDWQKLPAVQTLPEISESIPLSDDFYLNNYDVKIEFPEFVDLTPEAVVELIAKGVTLPDYPQTEVSVATSADKASLNVRFVPVVYRKGIYQRINSFKLSVISTPISATTLAATRAATLATTENSVLSSGRFVKIRVSDTGVYRITQAELRKMGFSNPDKVRIYGYGGICFRRNSQNTPLMIFPRCLYIVEAMESCFMPVVPFIGRKPVILLSV